MPGDSRLKPSTQRAFGSRKKRAWNKKAPATRAPSAAELESRPDPLDLPGTSTDDTVGPSSTSETLRVDAAYYSTAEQAQRVERSAQTKTVLSGKSATQRKFDLLGVSAECQTGDAGTDFLLVDMKVLNNFFAQAKCDKCDAKSLSVRKATDKEYGLAVKLIFSCSSCDFEKKQFSSPRVSGTATITPFEVNMRAMKGIQMIGKGVTALSDFSQLDALQPKAQEVTHWGPLGKPLVVFHDSSCSVGHALFVGIASRASTMELPALLLWLHGKSALPAVLTNVLGQA
ncbi:hypothetical protein HPB52_013423 [Rhipicephalus sanguineus]|uniref:Mutator-like transposase domain-containing protein n=1 Tax=Rhipicephalus sanguineus TaxID=34632 RepID=A0A9D4YPT0_RHISA|nr:hypothetical protein HPB52_013423 [Rhipicephalus sanguineus]